MAYWKASDDECRQCPSLWGANEAPPAICRYSWGLSCRAILDKTRISQSDEAIQLDKDRVQDGRVTISLNYSGIRPIVTRTSPFDLPVTGSNSAVGFLG